MCHVCYMCHGCAMGVQWACGAPSEYRAWWECGGGGGVSVTWVARVVGVLWVCNGCAVGVWGAECVQCVLGGCECVCHMCHMCHGCAMGVKWECGALCVCRVWWECVSVCVSRVSRVS